MRLSIPFTAALSAALIAAAMIASAKADEAICPPSQQVAAAPSGMSGIATHRLAQKTQAEYPQEVLAQDQQASVLLRYTVEADGHVDHIEVVRGVGAAFIQEAKRAVSQWVYTPAAQASPGVMASVKFYPAQ